jgi:N6-adenosine-specific RNA methylase IME4
MRGAPRHASPAPRENRESVIEAPWEGHSRKPEVFADMIAAYYPTCPKLEMFYRALDDPEAERVRRAKREANGWFFWGNEVETIPQGCAPPQVRELMLGRLLAVAC